MLDALQLSPQAVVRPAPVRVVVVLATVVALAFATAYLGLGAFGLGALVGLTGLAWLVLAPASTALAALLLLRGLSDGLAGQEIAFGLNPGSLLGLGVIGIAIARLALQPRRRGMQVTLIAVMFILVWTVVAYGRFGMDASIVREVVRSLSLVAIGLIAANHQGTLTYRRLADIVVITSLVPAVIAVTQGFEGLSTITDSTFRVRGTLAHSNSAAMFFAIAVVLCAWRWAYDGGGRRYLLATGLFMLAILFTKSMGGLGQAVVGLLVLGMLPRGGGNKAAVAFIAIAIVLFFVLDPLGLSRVGEISATNFSASNGADVTNSVDWRLVNYQEFLRVWWEGSPLVGLGLGSTTDLVRPFGELTHSEPLRWVVETGFIGFGILTVALLALVNALMVRLRRADGRAIFAALLGILAGLAVHGLVTHVSLTTAPMVLATAVLAAGITIADTEDPVPGTATGTATARTRRDARPQRPMRT